MDSISRPEFAEIFERVSSEIDLRGCTTAYEIEVKLKDVLDTRKTQHDIALASDYDRTRARAAVYGRKASWLDTLIEHDFAGRTISEASRNAHGMYAMTLKYGRQEAKRRILARQRAELRYTLAQRGIGRGLGTPVQRRPEQRRIPTYRRRLI